MLTVTINGAKVSGKEGMTILELARETGIDIPTLCYHQSLTPIGACRVCVVEVEGSKTLVASCHTPITPDMIIQTHSPKVLEARKVIVELLLASHPDVCIVCDKANICELRKVATDLEIGLPRFRLPRHYYPIEDENPDIVRDLSKCILCQRCVVACENPAGKRMFSMAYRGFQSKVIYGCDQPLTKETCRDSDACIALCPSGALLKPRRVGEGKARKALFVKG